MTSLLQKNKLILITFFLLITLTGCTTQTKTIQEPISEPNKEKVEDYNLSFFAVGDALIHDAVYNDAKTQEIDKDGYNIYNFTKMLTQIEPLAKKHDLAFYNQETIIGGKNLGLSNYPTFNSPDEIGLDMIKSGFNIVNLGTNHTLDKGTQGALYSVNFWENQDIYKTGSYISEEERNNIKIATKNGITYAVLSYTYGTNGIKLQEGYEYLVNVWTHSNKTKYEEYKEVVKKDIESVRNKVDLLIVSMHWGTEYTHIPNDYQKDQAEYLSSLGVDIIIGTHPHVIQPIEYIGNTLVIYSLGNFISAQKGVNKRVGMMVSLDINKHVENGATTISINNVKADLTWTYHEKYRNFQVIPFYNLKEEQLSNHEQIYEEYKAIINPTKNDRIKVGF